MTSTISTPARLGPALVVWSAWLILMAGANLATPLYAVYAQRYGFSSLVLTTIFATYAVVLVPGLVLFGRLSDRFGRRPVILTGLAVACAGLGATVAAALATFSLGERAAGGREPWRLQRPRVPKEIRSSFGRVSLTAAAVWASVALYLSIVPLYAGRLLRTHDLALLAAISAIALVSSAVAQIVSQRRRSARRPSQAIGLAVLAGGLLALVLAAPLHSLALLVAGALAAGAGHGVAILNAQEELNEIAPEERRGEVTAAFIACIYFLVAAAVISTGLLDLRFSLSLAVGAVSVVLVAVASGTAVWQARATRTAG